LSVHLVKISSLTLATLAVAKIEGARMATKSANSKGKASTEEKIDLSLNDLLVRGRVSAPATVKELPSGDKVVEFRLIVSRIDRDGVDTLDIAAWSGKSRKTALSLKSDEWIEVSGSVHRRFWQSPAGLASRWQIEAAEITRL
jgi:single-strand DNA-binding protein